MMVLSFENSSHYLPSVAPSWPQVEMASMPKITFKYNILILCAGFPRPDFH